MESKLTKIGNSLGPMEFFLLTLIGKLRLKSLYELRQHAGLEPGGIRSAMKSLEKDKLISKTDPGKRRRRDLAVTPEGSQFLENSWRACLRDFTDADAVLRMALVTLVMDGADAAAAYLSAVGQLRRERAQQMGYEREYLKRSQSGPLSSYAWMRISHEAHRRSAESEVFLSMSGSIKERFNAQESNAT